MEVRLEAKTACVFLCQIITPGIRMKPRYTDAFWGEHPFDGDMALTKNKNKNKVSRCKVGPASAGPVR